MNCEPGDLAIVVATADGDTGSIGSVVEVIRLGDTGAESKPGWVTSPAMDGHCRFYDSSLRPLRDNDGEDEILRIAGKPAKGVA